MSGIQNEQENKPTAIFQCHVTEFRVHAHARTRKHSYFSADLVTSHINICLYHNSVHCFQLNQIWLITLWLSCVELKITKQVSPFVNQPLYPSIHYMNGYNNLSFWTVCKNKNKTTGSLTTYTHSHNHVTKTTNSSVKNEGGSTAYTEQKNNNSVLYGKPQWIPMLKIRRSRPSYL